MLFVERELVKRERAAIKQLIADHEHEIARAKAASCIRDELLCEAFALIEILLQTAKQRFQLMAGYGKACPAELEEAWNTIVFAATRTDVPEFKEITNQLMLLYGEEWGRLANVDAHGLANQRVVRKLTIFANDTLVKQYLVDIMGADFDPEICFGTSTELIDDADAPQNAAQMERELAALRATASAVAPLSAPPDPFPTMSVGAPADADFRPVSDDEDRDDHHRKGGGGGGGGGGGVMASDPFPALPGDPAHDKPAHDHRASVTPKKTDDVAHAQHVAPPPVPTPPTSPPGPVTLAPSAPLTHVQNDQAIQRETASTAADDLLARFEALKPKRSNAPPRQPSPAPAPVEHDTAATPGATSAPSSTDATLDLLMSFPRVANSGDDIVTPDASVDLKDSTAADDIVLPSVPSDNQDDGTGGGGGGDDDGGTGLRLPSAPSTDLSRGIKSGSKEEKQLDELDDLAARFERLKNK